MRSALVHASQTSSMAARYVWLMVTVRASPASSTRVPTRRRTALICWVTSIMELSPLGLGCIAEAALTPAPGQFGGQRLQVRSQKRRNRSSHASSSRSGSEFTAYSRRVPSGRTVASPLSLSTLRCWDTAGW